MRLDTQDWKPFITSRLFPVMENGKANQQMLDEGKECFYVGAKKDDNGVMIHCQRDEALITNGNCIVFICNGQGSVGFANYMDVDFIGTTDIVAGYNEYLNEYNGTFLATIYSQERPKYSFGRKWKTHLKDTEVKLPVKRDADGSHVLDASCKWSDDGYIPDWQFMENYIKSLHHKPLTTKNKAGQVPELKVTEWKEFKIKDFFDVELSKGDIKLDDMDDGDIPLLSSGETNNGVVGYIDRNGDGKAEIFPSNRITVDMFCNAFYQDEPFYAVSHGRVNILVPRFELTKNIGLFIATAIKQEQYKYSYGRAVYSNVAAAMDIKLPVDTDGNPDWQFMENYIKALPYGDRLVEASKE